MPQNAFEEPLKLFCLSIDAANRNDFVRVREHHCAKAISHLPSPVQLRRIAVAVLAVLIGVSWGTNHLWGQTAGGFRVETDVLVSGQAQPVEQSIALFAEGIVYEYSRQLPNKITVVDWEANRIAFIDSQRRVQTRINIQELESYIEKARHDFAQTSGGAEKIKDAAQVSFDDQSQLLTVGDRFIRYSAKLQPVADPAMAELYAKFATTSAWINVWQSRGSAPPFARLQLNTAIQSRAALPTEIKRTVFIGDRHDELVSRIHLNISLSSNERRMIDQFSAMLVDCPTLTLAEFNQIDPGRNR